MFKLWPNKKNGESKDGAPLTWSAEAQQGLDQAVSQAPVPTMLKNKVRKELQGAAEEAARANGKNTVEAQDLMQGLLAKLPAGMRSQVEDALKEGPEGLKKLEKKFKR